MKKAQLVLAFAAMLPVFALMPACNAEVADEGEVTPAGAIDAPEGEAEGQVGLCFMDTYIGAGSCAAACSRGALCGVGKYKWTCSNYNYEHWKSYPEQYDSYVRTSGAFTITYCQGSNPANCTGFCN